MQNSLPKYYLLLAANPLSDSVVALAIFKIIRQLDIISGDDIKIYLPGFHKADKEDSSSIIKKIIEKKKNKLFLSCGILLANS